MSYAEKREQRWTEDDKDLLKEFYPEKGGKGMAELFNGRFTVREINRKANKLGLKRKYG